MAAILGKGVARMIKKSNDPVYDLIDVAMSVQNTLGNGATLSQYRRAMLNKLRALNYQVANADAILVVDDDGVMLVKLRPRFWILPLKLLIKVVKIKATMGYAHAEEARKYLRYKADAEAVLLLNFGMRELNSWEFPEIK
jgi:GxxExxY protein